MGIDVIFLIVFGLIMGSFLTVVSERINNLTLARLGGRSTCNHCSKQLSWRELIPFWGYVISRGRCATCNQLIPWRYPVFEIVTALFFVSGYIGLPQPVNYIYFTVTLGLIMLLLLLFFYDWVHRQFPPSVLGLAGLVVIVLVFLRSTIWANTSNLVQHSDPFFGWFNSPASLLSFYMIGGVVGAVLLGLVAWPSKGKWMGYGDVILAGILGLWLGYPHGLIALIVAFYLGAIVAIGLMITKQVHQNHQIAFGPFLILGALLVHGWSKQFISVIMKLWGIS